MASTLSFWGQSMVIQEILAFKRAVALERATAPLCDFSTTGDRFLGDLNRNPPPKKNNNNNNNTLQHRNCSQPQCGPIRMRSLSTDLAADCC